MAIKTDHATWWGKVDSNHRRHRQQIYSLSPLATREFPHYFGAGGRIRTPDLLITNQLLYQLSYTSIRPAEEIIPRFQCFVNNIISEMCKNEGEKGLTFAIKHI